MNKTYKGINREELINFKESGRTIPQLARMYKVAESTISYHIRKHRESLKEDK